MRQIHDKLKILILALPSAPVVVHAQVNYAVSGNTAYVTNSPNASGNVVITNTYDGYPVTSIGELCVRFHLVRNSAPAIDDTQ